MFRLHESLAPHMGLIGAAALIVAGGLLYWLAFARGGLTMHPSDLFKFSTGMSHEPAPLDAAPNAATESTPATEEPSQDGAWSAPPRVATSPPIAAGGSGDSPHADGKSSPGPDLAPPGDLPVPLPPVEESGSTPSRSNAAISPTPSSMLPTTPYPAYALGAGNPRAETLAPPVSHAGGWEDRPFTLPRP
jgi:hypothetical protein